jgi:alpha/beta superfamily hydrolase
VGHSDKEMHVIQGASHYYMGQPDKMAQSVATCLDWLRRKGFVG